MTARRLVLVVIAMTPLAAFAQGFAGLGSQAPGFETPKPGASIVFPKDHGAHDSFRTEWWYLTANLESADRARYGAQWTLFRHALEPRSGEGWDDRNVFMAHAAVTSDARHFFAQTMARGGVGQAGVETAPFRAYIDDWVFEARDVDLAAARVVARGAGFSYALDIRRDAPFVLQGEAGFSRKSDKGQASYYYSQPFFTVEGTLEIEGRETRVSGRAWMDREWSSQPLASDQKGWDWFSLHLSGGEKLMLFRLRGARDYYSGNWIARDGSTTLLAGEDIALEPLARAKIADRDIPTRWRVKVKSRGFDVETAPLNPRSWMGTSFPYWEGPIAFKGSHGGEGYLEMTGY